MSGWRKGCLCGCLTEDECMRIDRTPTVMHVVHHVMVHRQSELERPYIDAEVIDEGAAQ